MASSVKDDSPPMRLSQFADEVTIITASGVVKLTKALLAGLPLSLIHI